MRQKSLHAKKNQSSILDGPSKVASPFKADRIQPTMHASHENDDHHKTSIPKKRPTMSTQTKEVQSARTTHNKKSSSISRQGADFNLTRKEFDLEKFRGLFGMRKFAERRVQTEYTHSNGDLGARHKKQSSSISIVAPSLSKKTTQKTQKNSKDQNKQASLKRKTHRDRSNESASLAQRLISGLIAAKEARSRSRSKETEPKTPYIPSKQAVKDKMAKKKHPTKSDKLIVKDDKGSLGGLDSSGKIYEQPPSQLNANDFGFLFSKKLTNIEKMSLIQQRSQLIQDKKKRDLEKGELVKPSKHSLKRARLATNYSASDSLNTMNKGDLNSCNQEISKDSFLENQELEDQLEQAQKSDERNRPLASSRTKSNKRKSNLESNSGIHLQSKKKLSKKLFGRRKSFCEENVKEKAKRELNCELGDENISMTSEVRGYEDEGSMFEASGSFQGRSELQRSNSNILLRSVVSSSTNHFSSRDMFSLQEKIEVERSNLITYLKEYSKTQKTVPKTTLQFYKIIKLLGRGSFGKVHLGVHLLTRKKVAIKCIDKQYIMDEKAQGKVVQEIKILRGLSHKNIVKILEVFENKKYVFIVTDFAAKGDVLQYMKEHGIFKENKARYIAAQILNGLEYIHEKNILHRDIKLDNILLDKEFKVRICDFGVSRFMPKSNHSIKERCGTPAYIAPEIIKNQGYSGYLADVLFRDAGVEFRHLDLRDGHRHDSFQSKEHPRAPQADHRG